MPQKISAFELAINRLERQAAESISEDTDLLTVVSGLISAMLESTNSVTMGVETIRDGFIYLNRKRINDAILCTDRHLDRL